MEDSDGPPPPVSASTLPGQEPEIVQHGHWRGFVGRTKCQSPPIIRVFQRKRERPITAPESTIPRRTRDVPNISECHACGFRVDLSSGKNRLRILYSEWRVVLLCRKCMSLVESLAICSYCFKEVSEGFRCPNCTRRIHNSCFLDYKGCAPCSYSCSGSELSVCIDCWIPKSLARRHPLKRKRRAKKGRPIVCALTYDIVTEVQTAENELISLTKRENGSGAYGTSKNDACTRSIDNAVKQNVLLVGNSPGSKRYKMAAQDCAEMAVDDAELAFRLHRSMNSSPRISKILRVDKMSCMVYNRRMKKHTAEESRRTSESGNLSISGMALVRSNEGSLGNLDKNNSENPRALCHDFSANEHYYQASRVADQGSSQEDCACVFKCNEEEGNLHVQIKEGTGCSLNDMGHAFPTCSKYDDSVKLMNVGNVVNKDQYRLTYYKKRSNSDKGSRCKNLYDRINFENGMISACSNDGSLENLDKNNSGYYMASSHDASANVQLTEANRLPDQGCTQGDTLCPVKCSQVVGSLHAPIKEGEGSYLNSMGPKFLTCLKYDYHVKPTDVGNVGKKDQILLTLDKADWSKHR
ncbi:hypothetical protein SAY87_027465 [Trapa incisa]|uniref:Uncharacterized protein n=1 Tax=Trapa incisa TaxID=236973 RepID=A0AAN7GRT2_9MYRT|nr:hypothetical protein SAY87_027465 [Trapa incisa]